MKKLLFLASGRGTNFQSFLDHKKLGVLRNIEISALICNRKNSKVIDRAKNAAVPFFEIEGIVGKKYSTQMELDEARIVFDKKCLEIVAKLGIDFVVLAGFDQIVSRTFVDAFPFKILNIHPAYDMKRFGGHKMVGSRVHESVLSAASNYSGCTVHFVTNDIDKGPIILKRQVPVFPDDTASKLEARVLREEHLAYPEAVQLLADGRVVVSDSGKRCFVDLFSDDWDVDWLERQDEYVRTLKSFVEVI